jgi:hypothetical protein
MYAGNNAMFLFLLNWHTRCFSWVFSMPCMLSFLMPSAAALRRHFIIFDSVMKVLTEVYRDGCSDSTNITVDIGEEACTVAQVVEIIRDRYGVSSDMISVQQRGFAISGSTVLADDGTSRIFVHQYTSPDLSMQSSSLGDRGYEG